MAVRKTLKKDFNKDQMYRKIMPSILITGEETEAKSAEPDKREHAHNACNLMECIVLDKMEHVVKMLRACGCQQCRDDILCLSLNQLPSMYAVLEQDRQEQRIREIRRSYEVKVTTAMILATQQVSAYPRHDKTE